MTSLIFSKLCGYFIPRNNIPRGWYWVYVISWFTYALRGLAKNDLTGIVHACTPSIVDTCRFTTGEQALEVLYEIDVSIDKWDDILSLFYFWITFHFGAQRHQGMQAVEDC